ncbi:MAG: thioredoxin family protein [Proteobacteria bacterium]|nr:thioredoxin family protein [Pseudomonadota bacterium]
MLISTLRKAFALSLLLAAGAAVLPPSAHAQLPAPAQAVVSTPRVRAELMAYAPDGVTPGARIWVGLQLQHQPQWHTYWKNAGDSGLPTELNWTLPAGVSAADVAWPTPHKIPVGTLANFGYENTVLLPVQLTVSPEFKPPVSLMGGSDLDVRLKASWLVCKQECIPEEGNFALKLPVQGATALNRPAFETAFEAQPAELAQPAQIEVQGQQLKLRVDGLPASAQGRTLEFFPETGEVVHNAAVSGRDWKQSWQGSTWTASYPLAEQRSASPDIMPIVLALAQPKTGDKPLAWRTEAKVSGTWPANAAPAAHAEVSPALQAALAENAAGPAPVSTAPTAFAASSLAVALVGALLGGLLLNLMPCVFPVLAIKVLGFARQSGDHGGHRRAALAYTAGVMISLLALAAAMLALRAAGAQLGWGFQLQSPAVVAGLAALFTLIGLNLAGVFEFGRMAPAALGGARSSRPLVNDFLSGVLAVVIASPCTAPFMGASLGFAITLPAPQAMLLFAALGFGLALPYLLAGFIPAVARLLPRPGGWMRTLQRLLAFPMFGTVAWLVWVLGQQSGIDGAGALLALLVCLAALVWAFTLHGRSRVVVASIFLACTVVLAASIGPNIVQGAPAVASASSPQDRWQPWSSQRVAELTAEGRPVFVDFTAAWCVTCQYNKKATLADADVLAQFKAKNVALLRADWTRRDQAITAALTALGRSGVPVYVLHAPGKPPVVLSEILSKDELGAALSGL